MVNVGIIGYGYWGPNLVRNFATTPGCKVKRVVDARAERLKVLNNLYPSILATQNVNDIFSDADIDAIVIATPVFTHFDLAKKTLDSGKHVLVEKPFTPTVDEAIRLIELAESKKKVIMVDHTFIYNGAVRKIKELIDKG